MGCCRNFKSSKGSMGVQAQGAMLPSIHSGFVLWALEIPPIVLQRPWEWLLLLLLQTHVATQFEVLVGVGLEKPRFHGSCSGLSWQGHIAFWNLVHKLAAPTLGSPLHSSPPHCPKVVPVIQLGLLPEMAVHTSFPGFHGCYEAASDVPEPNAVPAIPASGCLLYTSDAADEEDSVDLGGRRIIEKKK
eukprot:TRINITY_DN1909_c0_g2_i4.p1 TRINITY_DN1909_c0_g2~~TRINITY_DN1909_c0_g2_i4.p1  ORF type:complete len:188 (-),score=22.49 TRINITY_DN1909_c0_g2_i4:60-623(-)